MAEDEQRSRVSLSFSSSFDSLRAAEAGGDKLYYHENDQGGVTPILFSDGRYRQLVKKPASKDSYLTMRDQCYKEAKKKVCQVLAIGGAFFCLAKLRRKPEVHTFVKNYLTNTPVFWGITLPPALAFEPRFFNPYEKYQEGRAIEKFLSKKEESLAESTESFIAKLQKGLGLSYPLKTEIDVKKEAEDFKED